ncbi:hypothetical protein AYJ58_16745 [Shewanella sp. Pdp11]|nr:hypothetical protein AYJ58_16745 [Shewanella sp. Pdp11]
MLSGFFILMLFIFGVGDMRVLVTGGAGFIGLALVRILIQQTDCHVLNLDKLTYASHSDAFADIAANERYHFIQADFGLP